MIEEVFRTLLVEDPTVAGLVGQRVYPFALPQDCTLPAIHYLRISASGGLTQDGATGITDAVFRFEAWGDDPMTAKRVANAIKARLHGLNGTFSGIQISAMRLSGETDLREADPVSYRVVIDFNLNYRD